MSIPRSLLRLVAVSIAGIALLPTVHAQIPSATIKWVSVNGTNIDVRGSESPTVNGGDEVEIEVQVQNYGDEWWGIGQCVVWVKNYANVDSVEKRQYSGSYDNDGYIVPPIEEFSKGSTKWFKDGENQIVTDHYSVDASQDHWPVGNDGRQTLAIHLTAPQSGQIVFLVRATFSDRDWKVIADPYGVDPRNGSPGVIETDQQGYRCRKYVINVAAAKTPTRLTATSRRARPGQVIRLSSRLEYKNFIGAWVAAESLPVDFYVDGTKVGTGQSTSASSVANVEYDYECPSSWGNGTKTWNARFAGNTDYAACQSDNATLTVSVPPWGSESAPYGLADDLADSTNPSGKRRGDSEYRYRYCRFGLVLDNDNMVAGESDADLLYRALTNVGTGDGYKNELFVMRSPANAFNSEPEKCFSPEGEYVPWSALTVQHNSGSRTIVLQDVESGWNYHLFRRLHFTDNLRNANGTPASISKTKLIVLVHGWNPNGEANPYSGSPLGAMATSANTWLVANGESDWQVLIYNWSADADTGNWSDSPYPRKPEMRDYPPPEVAAVDPWFEQNSTEAAEAGHAHGQYLGNVLSGVSSLEAVQVIAHSAGSWVARTAAIQVLENRPGVSVQVTLLDPYMPRQAGSDSALGKSIMDHLDDTGSGRPVLLENYFSIDTKTDILGSCTSQVFEWSGTTYIQRQLAVSSDPYYATHGGPVEFYRDTVNSELGTGGVTPNSWWTWDWRQAGWFKSLPYNEWLTFAPTVSGRITRSDNGAGAEDVVVTFSNNGGATAADSGGYYSKKVPKGWTGTATPSYGSWTFSPPSRDYSSPVTSDRSDQNFVGTPPANPTISGRVTRSDNGEGLPGVTITFPNADTTTTNENGYYTQEVPRGWGGTATPSYGSWTFEPYGRTYDYVTADEVNQDYIGTPPVGELPNLAAPSYGWKSINVTEGTPFWIEVEVKNVGTAAAGPSHVALYLSPNDNWNLADGDVFIETKAVGLLARDTGQVIHWDFTFPAINGVGNPYPVWIIAVVDCNNEVAESQENNVWKCATPLSVTKGAIPQAALPAISPSAGTYSSPISITVGCDTPGASIYYTVDGSVPSETSFAYPASGFSISGADGTQKTVKARAFKSGYTPSDTASNTYTFEGGGQPDLVADVARWPGAQASEGQPYWFEPTIKNIGTSAAGASHMRFFLSPGDDGNTGDDYEVLPEKYVKALAPNETSFARWEFNFPDLSNAATYTRWLLIMVDSKGEVGETDEFNLFKYRDAVVVSNAGTMLGDVNGDHQVLANDASLALRLSIGLSVTIPSGMTLTQMRQAADVTRDGQVLANDAQQILRKSIGLPVNFKGLDERISITHPMLKE